MTRPLLTAVIALALAGLGLAQGLGPPVTATFAAEDVQARQGKLDLDPTSHTILRFFDAVTFAFSRRSDILKAVPKGNDVVLYAMAEKAETDLSVLVDGNWHFFAVRIAKGAGLRFYEVKPRGAGDVAKDGVHNAVNPPSNPAGILCDPARDFWPLIPRPEYRPLPEPRPRPTRLRPSAIRRR